MKKIKERFKYIIRNVIDVDEYISNYGCSYNYEIDVSEARHNYKLYQDDLKERERNLIEQWCQEIRDASRNGRKYIYTNKFVVADDKDEILYLIDDSGCPCDFPCNSSLGYFQQYFEKRGFSVIKEECRFDMCFLQIGWIQ